jgi:hypothetical protein
MSVEKVSIKIEDDCVELNVDGSVFKLSLDERGVPQFPESVKQQLPPYMPKEVEEIISRMSKNTVENLDVVHQYWCQELAGIGMCKCDPVLCPSDLRGLWASGEGSWGTYICVVCHASSSGRTGSVYVRYNLDSLFQKHWVYKDNQEDDNRIYWAFSNETLICEDCLGNIMAEEGIDFPNAIHFRPSLSRARKPVLRAFCYMKRVK